jgi:hypothetical protein
LSKQFRPARVTIDASVPLIVSSIGFFSLVKKEDNFNAGLGDDWMSEVGFMLMSVIPASEVAAFIDA